MVHFISLVLETVIQADRHPSRNVDLPDHKSRRAAEASVAFPQWLSTKLGTMSLALGLIHVLVLAATPWFRECGFGRKET